LLQTVTLSHFQDTPFRGPYSDIIICKIKTYIKIAGAFLRTLRHKAQHEASRWAVLGKTNTLYITSRGEGFWGKNLAMLMGANPQIFGRSWDGADANYLFFQKTPFFCLLNAKQTKIRGDFIFRTCKSARF
jgi:hypothetical protein